MPWHHTYEPAPKDMSLPVLEKLPDDYREDGLFGYKSARRNWSEDVLQKRRAPTAEELARPLHFYHCPDCKGWIEGMPNDYRVNTLDGSRLAGRRGTEYHCRRCGEQIGFMGIMS